MSGLLSRHPGAEWPTTNLTRLMATLVAMSLSACDTGPVPTTAVTNEDLEPIVQAAPKPRPNSFRAGPHGGHDPHAGLTPDKHARVALQHLAEDRPVEALNTLDQAIAQYPEAAELHGIRGSLLLEQGEVTEALASLESAVRLAPDNPLHLTNRAQAYRKFNRTDEALADLDRAIEIDTGLLSARFNRGALSFSQGDFETALIDFEQCIAIDPHTAAPWFNRAAVYEATGRREEAIADLRRFLEIAPSEEWKTTAEELLQQWEAAAKPDTS